MLSVKAADRSAARTATGSPRRTLLDAEAVAALLAARGQDTPAVLGLHPGKEAVDALAAPVVRLIGPLHERVLLGYVEVVEQPNRPGTTAKYTGHRGRRQGNSLRCESFLTCPHLWRALCISTRADALPNRTVRASRRIHRVWEGRGYVVPAALERPSAACGQVHNSGGKQRRKPPPPGQLPPLILRRRVLSRRPGLCGR